MKNNQTKMLRQFNKMNARYADGKKYQNGFTLFELMVGIVIVGILAAISLPIYETSIVRSQRSAAESQMERIAGELAAYRAKNLSYKLFDPTYMYGSSVDALTKSVVTLPVTNPVATGSLVQYTIKIWDVSAPVAVALNAGLGRQWAITGTINLSNSFSAMNYNLLLTSGGTKCMTKNTIPAPYISCGAGSVDW
jgi:type IV pilus assembly protein PilE